MALIKSFNTQFGVQAVYHKLQKVEIDSTRQEMVVQVAIYTSEEAKALGAAPIWNEYITIPFNELQWDPRDIFYPLLKEYVQSYLENAADSVDLNTVHPPVFDLVPAAKV